MNNAIIYYLNYSPIGDIIVLSVCFVLFILMNVAFISKTKEYSLLKGMVGLLITASVSNLFFEVMLVDRADVSNLASIYLMRIIYHLSLSCILFLLVIYVTRAMHLNARPDRFFLPLASIGLAADIIFEVFSPWIHWGFFIFPDDTIAVGFDMFSLECFYFMVILLYIMIHYRERIFRQIIYGITGSYLMFLTIMIMQKFFHQTSYTTSSFLYPIIAMMYLLHSKPYDIEIGTVDVSAFKDVISESISHHRTLQLISLFMHEFEGTGKQYPQEIRDAIRQFHNSYFKGAVLFQISSGRMLLAVDMKKNPKYKDLTKKMLDLFLEEYPKFRLDYKIVIMNTFQDATLQRDYARFFPYIESHMEENSIHFVDENDLNAYRRHKYIRQQLKDICDKKDLNDDRVKAFCQPVFNLHTGSYDTAEALMRLELPELGMIYPDIFIPIAERHQYIHTLSLIILNKTCRNIRKLLNQGYHLKRISVNFSVLEMRNPNFCKDITEIIHASDIPYEKIAIEITESQNENDFNIMKKKISELKENGIKFYLDDFGTGYSNFERIMELPFDIIKFDRSLVLACANDIKSEKMVSHLARMFNDMNYSVLYEGVETTQDEEKCKNMFARYLQGYKYSRPIPMEDLTKYFRKEA